MTDDRLDRARDAIVRFVDDGQDPADMHRELSDAIELDERAKIESLIQRAMISYVTDPLQRAPQAFYPILEGRMPLKRFLLRASIDRWNAKREEIRRAAQAELIRSLGGQVVREQLREAQEIQRLRGYLVRYLVPKEDEQGNLFWPVEPASLEGAIKAFKDLTVLLQAYRATLTAQLEQHHATAGVIDVQSAPQEQSSSISEEQAQKIARFLLEEEMRERQRK